MSYAFTRLVRALWLWLGGPEWYERYDRVICGVAMAVILFCGIVGVPVATVYTVVSIR